MTIASEKVALASERFQLVRLNPGRYIEPTINGGVYEITLPVILNKIERNGVELTKDTSTPSVNDHWYQNESTGLVQVKLASAPNSTTNILISYYYLFYTGTMFRAIYENPEDSATTVRNWEPRITTYPTLTQSFDNILAGIFTISDTSIEIINEDGQFQEYLTDNDSFYNKDVDIWLCINSVDNIQKIFSGTIRSVQLNQNTVSISVVDRFNSLKQPAYMGDTSDESYFRLDGFANLDPKDAEKPCPYIVGESSRYETEGFDADISGTVPYQLSVGTPAVDISYDADFTTSNNRTWGCCRLDTGLATQSYATAQATTTSGNYILIRFSSISNVTIGDTFRWTNGGSPYYGKVCHVGTFTHLAVNYNLIVESPNPYLITDTVIAYPSFGVFIERVDGERVYPLYDRDYTVSSTATSGGNVFLSIVFTSNFEANFSLVDPLTPASDVVSFRTSNSVIDSHADIIQRFCEGSGLSINAASFATAYAGLPVKARFHIPNFDEETYKTYLEYAQDVLSSALGYLKLNIDTEVEYHILSAPSSTSVRDNLLMLEQATSATVEYQDIVTQIIAFNPHNGSIQEVSASPSPSETRENVKARRLHGLENVDRFRHVLEEIGSNIDDHMALKSMRKATYAFSTATEDIDTELGDDVQLENKIVLGTSDTQDIKIITIEKSPAKINLVGQDLKGL